MALMDSITDIFRDVFNDPTLIIDEETNSSSIQDYDSFAHINIIVSMEEKFNVNFTTPELGKMTCVRDVIRILNKKGVK